MTPVVELVDVTRTFPGTPPVEALRSVSLTVEPGESVAIVGPSGSGKSTLLNVVGLLDRPSSGTYRLDGIDVSTLGDGARTALRGQRIGFVFQSFHLLSHRTTIENVMLAEVYQRGTERKGRRERAAQALQRVGLAHRIEFRPTLLSGGERQRVAIARAIVANPSLLLADEPTGNLDSRTTASILGLFDELARGGLTIITITHDRDVASRFGRIAEMADGVLTDRTIVR